MKRRCAWVTDDEAYIKYHDFEWGRPVFDDRKIFEMLCLEGAQAGLSWITILKKRKRYRELYYYFEIEKVAVMSDHELHRILNDKGIVRNKLKVFAFRKNAKASLALIREKGSLKNYFWSFVNNEPIMNRFKSVEDVPAQTALSKTISIDLKKRGFTFAGPTIIYAFMQAIGMVNDHTEMCFLRQSDAF